LQAFRTMNKWITSAKKLKEIEYIFSLDESDIELQSYLDMPILPTVNKPQVLIGNNKSAIEAVNAAAEKCTGDLIIQISDDFSTPPFHWDAALMEALEGKEDYLVKTWDGIQRTLVTLPIMDRKYYNRFGYIYYPEYTHMSSDVELTAVAHMLGRIIELPITIKHNHYSTTGKNPDAVPFDAVNKKNDATYTIGAAIYSKRAKTLFGLDPSQIVKPLSAIKW
jgi:hypothetical protein